jgi:signal transduction histidine kinase
MAITPIAQPATAPYKENLVTVTLNPAKAKLVFANILDQHVKATPSGAAVTVTVHASDVASLKKAGVIV